MTPRRSTDPALLRIQERETAYFFESACVVSALHITVQQTEDCVHPSLKLGLLYGSSGTAGSLFLGGLFATAANASFGGPAILLCGLPLALSVVAASVVASRRGWLRPSTSFKRTAIASLPLTFFPIALIVGWVGWGDMQEHSIRTLLHLTHREVTDRIAAVLIMVGITVTSGISSGVLVWMSVSLSV